MFSRLFLDHLRLGILSPRHRALPWNAFHAMRSRNPHRDLVARRASMRSEAFFGAIPSFSVARNACNGAVRDVFRRCSHPGNRASKRPDGPQVSGSIYTRPCAHPSILRVTFGARLRTEPESSRKPLDAKRKCVSRARRRRYSHYDVRDGACARRRLRRAARVSERRLEQRKK